MNHSLQITGQALNDGNKSLKSRFKEYSFKISNGQIQC